MANVVSSTLLSIILAILYFSLYKENKEQTRAQRATYTPNLDVSMSKRDEGFILTLINSGEGTAKNVVVKVKLCTANMRNYIYECRLNKSIKDSSYIDDSSPDVGKGQIYVKPEFPIQGVLNGFMRDVLEYENQKGGTDIFDGLSFTLEVEYQDILGDQTYVEEIENAHIKIEDGELDPLRVWTLEEAVENVKSSSDSWLQGFLSAERVKLRENSNSVGIYLRKLMKKFYSYGSKVDEEKIEEKEIILRKITS